MMGNQHTLEGLQELSLVPLEGLLNVPAGELSSDISLPWMKNPLNVLEPLRVTVACVEGGGGGRKSMSG